MHAYRRAILVSWAWNSTFSPGLIPCYNQICPRPGFCTPKRWDCQELMMELWKKKLSRRLFLGSALALFETSGCRSSKAGADPLGAKKESKLVKSSTMPVIFTAHGAPTMALDQEWGSTFRKWGQKLPRPRAVLVVSAHWEEAPLTIGRISNHDTLLYDFRMGDPNGPLYQFRYPAPGAPDLELELKGVFADQGLLQKDRLLDHGVWTPLAHLWPKADIPVIQISMPRNLDAAQLAAMGARLAPLRKQGVLILGTGNLTHNLRWVFGNKGPETPQWAAEFDGWCRERVLARDLDALIDWKARAPAAQIAHPTPDHYRPLLVVAGAAGDSQASLEFTGFDYGSLSRLSFQYG